MTTARKPGRRTKREELAEFAASAGIDPELVGEFLGGALPPAPLTDDELGDPPDRFEDWLPEMRRILWRKIQDLDGVAAVQAQKLVKELVVMEREDAAPLAEAEERRPVLDRMHALPADVAMNLIKQEIGRMDAYRADLFAALEELEAT